MVPRVGNAFRNSKKNYLSVPQKSSFLAIIFLICGCRVLLSGALLSGGLFPARITQKYKSSPGKILATYYKVFLFSSMFHGPEFRVVFSSAEWFGTKFREFASILFHGTEFRAFFSSEEWVRNGIPRFCVPRNRRNSVGIDQFSAYSVFRGIIFLLEIANPTGGCLGMAIPEAGWDSTSATKLDVTTVRNLYLSFATILFLITHYL